VFILSLVTHPTDTTVCIDEVDPYKKPKDLLEVSPKGLVPGVRFENFKPPRALNESTVILEYLEEYVSPFSLHVMAMRLILGIFDTAFLP
jgi:glutathione S-transferase